MPLNILIADDHFPVRLGLELIVKETVGQWTQIDFARNGSEILQKMKHTRYDMLITDINMPGSGITSTVTEALGEQPDLKILVVSVSPQETFAPILLQCGAYGYISKDDNDNNLKNAINGILLGKKYFASDLLHEKKVQSENPFSKLSTREFEIACLLVKGTSIVEMGKILQLETSTVSTYKGRVFRKLNVNTIVELTFIANKFKLITNETHLY